MNIKASVCHCGKETVPPRPRCPHCGKQMDQTEVSNRGMVLSYSVLHVPPEGFPSPLKVALVQLESGARVFCTYEKEAAVDATVEVIAEGGKFRIKD